MAIRYQEKKTWTDTLLGRPWREPKTPMVLTSEIVAYNPVYLSVLCGLNVPGQDHRWVHSIEFSGKIEKYLTVERSRKPRWIHRYLNEFVKHETRPWFIVNGDTNTMAKLRITGPELKALRDREIAVYFYEPLFFRGAKFYDMSTRVTFPEFDWLRDFNANHGGNLKIAAYVCDYDLASYLKKWGLYPEIEVKTFDIFVADYAYLQGLRAPWAVPWAPEKVSKKFICLNFRHEGFREYVVGYLFGKGYHEEGNISFFHSHHEGIFRHLLPFPAESGPAWPVVKAGIEKMQDSLPLVLDTANSKVVGADSGQLPDWKPGENIRKDTALQKFYLESFLCIVNETRYGSANGEISEKTLIPIMMKRPFVIVGAPHMIRYLKEMGYETFGEFWDESYDSIEDHARRMEKILSLLDDILSRPLEELRSMLVRMKGILERNRKHFYENFTTELHRQIAADAGPRRT
ncbi:MAG TPA: hypothetical protein PL182_03090 [Pseudobdellovibrionaceae bacterium]|nr:hypothetical protein [Pseudobdellovibrionaceae bacterium]